MQFINRKEMLDIDDNGSQVAQNLEMVNTTEASGIALSLSLSHTHTHTHTLICHIAEIYIYIALLPPYSWADTG